MDKDAALGAFIASIEKTPVLHMCQRQVPLWQLINELEQLNKWKNLHDDGRARKQQHSHKVVRFTV